MSDLNDNREGGLFSDDYEIPKRENPYKKKKKTAPTKDRSASYVSAEDKLASESQKTADIRTSERRLKDRWDDFIFAHVKLICFIGGVIAVLLFISAPAIYDAVMDAQRQAEIESKPPLTLAYIHGLSDKSSPITWRDFAEFPYEETNASDSVTWMLDVKDTNFEIWISGISTQNLPTYIYLYDMSTGDKVDLTEGSFALEEFLNGRE